jgi:hypothetical protein
LSTPLPPSPVSKLDSTGDAHRKTEKERQLADERGEKGVGKEPNHTTARSLVFYKSFSTLWVTTEHIKKRKRCGKLETIVLSCFSYFKKSKTFLSPDDIKRK